MNNHRIIIEMTVFTFRVKPVFHFGTKPYSCKTKLGGGGGAGVDCMRKRIKYSQFES